MTSASHGKAKRRVWLCAAQRTAEKRKSSSGRKNKKQDEPHHPSPLLLESSSRGPRPPTPPAPTCAAAAPPPARRGHLGLGLPPRAGEPLRLPQPGPAAPLPTTAGPNSWRGPVAQKRGRTVRRLRPGPEAAGSRREGACQPCPAPQPASDSSYLGRRGERRGHQHGASATSAAQLRPSARVTSSAALPARGGPRHGSGGGPERGRDRGPVLSTSNRHRHTPSVGLVGAGTALYAVCARL